MGRMDQDARHSGVIASAEVAEAWLKMVQQRGWGHGAELVEALGHAGQPDNVVDAQVLLRAWVEDGTLHRCRFAPTRDQQFFDCNGDLKRSPEFHFEAFHYAPSRL